MKTVFLTYAATQVLIVLFFARIVYVRTRQAMEREQLERLRVTATGPRIGRK